MLQKEQEALAKRREETAVAAAAARDAGSAGADYGSYGDTGAYGDAGMTGEEAASTGGGAGTTGDSRDVAVAAGSQPRSTQGSTGTSPPPSDIPNGADDDIVARQLREAAMSEDDPELRERLWDEYRVYKTGKKKPTDTQDREAPRAQEEDETTVTEEEQAGSGDEQSDEEREAGKQPSDEPEGQTEAEPRG